MQIINLSVMTEEGCHLRVVVKFLNLSCEALIVWKYYILIMTSV
jgi:hypothetical protein